MLLLNEIAAPGKWTASSSGGGFAGPYRFMSREVLLSEVGPDGGESRLMLEVGQAGPPGYQFSFLYYPEITSKNGEVTILEIDDLVRITQSDGIAPGAFWIETPGARRRSPDYSLYVGRWNYFELSVYPNGMFDVLVNGRLMGGGVIRPPEPARNIKLSLGCRETTARSMWGELRFRYCEQQDIRLDNHTLQSHGFFQSVTYDNPDMHMLFDGRCIRGENLFTQGDWQYPGFQRGSTLYDAPLADIDELSCFGVRWQGACYKSPYTNRIELNCHQDYELEVHSAGGRIVAFSTTSTTIFNPLQCTATYYLFSELPGVIFCDCQIENIFHEPQPELRETYITYMMFTQGERDTDGNRNVPAYNGFRMWPQARESLSYFYGQDAAVLYVKPDEIDAQSGVFVKWPQMQNDYYGVWFTGETPGVYRGLAVMQKDGKNDWAVSPPVGNIFANDRHYGTFTSDTEEYTSLATGMKLPDDMSCPGSVCENEMIFFALKPQCPINSEEQLFNLERSFNHPLEVRIDPVCGEEQDVYLRETEGLHRLWQIVSLPWSYGDMTFEPGITDVFRGNAYAGRKPVKTVLLLKDVKPYEEIKLGTLPGQEV